MIHTTAQTKSTEMALRRSAGNSEEIFQEKANIRKPQGKVLGRLLFLDDMLYSQKSAIDLDVDGYEILRLDSSSVRGCSVSEVANESVQAMQSIGWPSAHILGFGFGGMVAQYIAIK